MSKSKMGLWGKIKVSIRLGSSGGSRGESVPCFVQLLEAICIPWLMVPSFIFRGSHYITPASTSILMSPPCLWPPSSCLFSLMKIGLHWTSRITSPSQDINSITSAKSPLPYNIFLGSKVSDGNIFRGRELPQLIFCFSFILILPYL